MNQRPEPGLPPPLALQACRLLDRRGEFAMLPVLMSQADPDAGESDWLRQGLLPLNDGSHVTHQDSCYSFRWHALSGQLQERTRLSHMPENGRPRLTAQRQPLVLEPTVQDLWNRVIQAIEEQAGLELQQAAISRAQSYIIAPDLHHQVQLAAADGTHNVLDEPQHSHLLSVCAVNVLQGLPPAQLEALAAHISAATSAA